MTTILSFRLRHGRSRLQTQESRRSHSTAKDIGRAVIQSLDQPRWCSRSTTVCTFIYVSRSTIYRDYILLRKKGSIVGVVDPCLSFLNAQHHPSHLCPPLRGLHSTSSCLAWQCTKNIKRTLWTVAAETHLPSTLSSLRVSSSFCGSLFPDPLKTTEWLARRSVSSLPLQ